jgi:hypothetical protein
MKPMRPYVLDDAATLEYQRLDLEDIDRVVERGRLDAATFDAASDPLDDPDYWTQCWMMTAVWARKPVA